MLKKTSNLQDAEDLAQETVLKLYRILLISEIENMPAYVWRAAQFFRTTLSQNIAYCVWQEGKTIHEIAEALGVDLNKVRI